MNPRRASALALLAMMAFVLADVAFPAEQIRWAARAMLLAYVVLEWQPMAGNARIMVAVAAAMTVTYGLMHDQPWAALAQACDYATFFATFFANQFFLREAARSSPLVHRCSSLFIDQKPARRYLLLTIGGYLFGIIVNLGVLSLLGQMIAKRNTLAAAGGNATLFHRRRQRMALALLRGFSVTPVASPLSLSLAVVLTALPDLHWSRMVVLGLGSGAIILVLGYAQDRLSAPLVVPAIRQVLQPARHDYWALLGIVAIVLMVLGLAKTLEYGAHIAPSRAILLALPAIGLAWLARQYLRFPPARMIRLLARRITRRATKSFPAYRSEVSILASAGFIGSLFSAFVPPELLSQVLTSHWLPEMALAPMLMALVIMAGLFGINPIVVVTIGASTLKAVPVLPVPAELLALALMIGWSMAINTSALTASAMLLADIIGERKPSTIIAWNAATAAATALVFAVLLAAGAALWG